ncbi:Nucleotidyltransferase [Geodermatophilus africanus]|uniref:Nucleotidyltransferase n=1 Tax=Geodermatophilus africanus TaxID=1137993 RepID=A0A1H3HYT9_9ACTN|nr:nucleotidyltransferase family protein [Geodermatophilus africanus]SDY19944.1 Nucleotidyltransferase [Geodermatophilus africanus]
MSAESRFRPRGYAPYGYGGLFSLVVRPNPHSPAPRHLYEAKARRWTSVWPELAVLPWDDGIPHR